MSKKAEEMKSLKKDKSKHHKDISSLKKLLADYRVERKAHWKSFKAKMKNEIGKIKKSIDKLAKKSGRK